MKWTHTTSTTRMRVRALSCVLGAAVLITFISAPHLLLAGTFNWGDLEDPNGDVIYLNVEEMNTLETSLFAPPPDTSTPVVVGNQILFDPQNFQVQAGGETVTDFLDSTLTTTLMAKEGKFIRTIHVREDGDYSLNGLSGGEASASIGASFFVTVMEVNGMPNVRGADDSPG